MKDLRNYTDEEISAILMNLTDENADLLIEILQADEDQIQQTLSEMQKISSVAQQLKDKLEQTVSERQELEQKVLQLTEQIERLSESDEQLKDAEQKLSAVKLREERIKEREKEIETMARHCEYREQDLREERRRLQEDRKKLEKEVQAYHEKIEERATEKAQEAEEKLRKEYTVKREATVIPTWYGIILTGLLALRDRGLVTAGWQCCKLIGKVIAAIAIACWRMLTTPYYQGYYADRPVVAVLVGVVLPFVVVILIIVAVYALVRKIPRQIERIKPYCDVIMLWTVLLILAIITVYADIMMDAGWNPVWLGLVAFMLILIIRMVADPERRWDDV